MRGTLLRHARAAGVHAARQRVRSACARVAALFHPHLLLQGASLQQQRLDGGVSLASSDLQSALIVSVDVRAPVEEAPDSRSINPSVSSFHSETRDSVMHPMKTNLTLTSQETASTRDIRSR